MRILGAEFSLNGLVFAFLMALSDSFIPWLFSYESLGVAEAFVVGLICHAIGRGSKEDDANI